MLRTQLFETLPPLLPSLSLPLPIPLLSLRSKVRPLAAPVSRRCPFFCAFPETGSGLFLIYLN